MFRDLFFCFFLITIFLGYPGFISICAGTIFIFFVLQRHFSLSWEDLLVYITKVGQILIDFVTNKCGKVIAGSDVLSDICRYLETYCLLMTGALTAVAVSVGVNYYFDKQEEPYRLKFEYRKAQSYLLDNTTVNLDSLKTIEINDPNSYRLWWELRNQFSVLLKQFCSTSNRVTRAQIDPQLDILENQLIQLVDKFGLPELKKTFIPTTIYETKFNVMDQFANMDGCTYMNTKQYLNQMNFSFTLWSLGLLILFCLIILCYLIFFRNVTLLVPKAWLIGLLEIYFFFSNLIKSNIHVFFYFLNLISLLFFVFLIIFLFNIISLIPYTFAYTSHISLTFTLSTILLSLINIIGVERLGAFFLKIFLPAGSPVALSFFLIPIEFTSYNTRVLSLAIRLFANIMSGHILLTIFAQFGMVGVLIILLVVVTIMLAVYFLESVISFLQSYVFLTLTSIYLHENIILLF